MEQELQAVGGHEFGHYGNLSKQGFAVLLELARGHVASDELHASTMMPPSELRRLLDYLRRDRLVSPVSELEGRRVAETLRLTDKGERVLLREMEQMCELPEI
jgi:transcription initiation factor IIE alpha subunit